MHATLWIIRSKHFEYPTHLGRVELTYFPDFTGMTKDVPGRQEFVVGQKPVFLTLIESLLYPDGENEYWNSLMIQPLLH